MKKRIIAITLCFVMLMTLIPMTVSAQEPQSIDHTESEINKKDIMISYLDIDNRKVEFIGVSDEDADKVSIDFDKLKIEPVGDDVIVEEDLLVQQGYIKIRGVVTENAYTCLDCWKTIDTSEEETVEIVITDAFETANKDFQPDDYGCYEIRDYLVGNTNAADFLGMSVIAYVKKVDDDYEIISIVADPTRNNILEIDLTQFNQINSQGRFEYFKSADAKTATAVVISGADVVFNNEGGYRVTDIFGDEVANGGATLNGGKITLIDNDTTYGYDVIFVEIAETAVVDEAEEGYVAFKEMTAFTGLMDLTIDEDDENVIISITKDGEAVAASALKEWDVLSIIANDDGSYIKAEVITNKIIGVIKSVSRSYTSETGYAYTIGGTKYDVAAGAYGIADLCIGAGGTFYIDKYGKIAAFNEDYALATGQSINYAYVTAATLDADVLTGANTALIQMVTDEGLAVFNIKATNAKINYALFDADAVGAATTLDALEGTVVKYTKNSNDLITAITSADVDDDFVSVAGASTKTYDAENGKFVSGHYIDADALVFFIAPEAEDSYVGSVAELEDEVPYYIYAIYADDKAIDNNILVVAGGAGSISPKTNMGVLTAIGTSENEDGEAIYAVEVMVNGETITAETTADAYYAIWGDLTVGDIIKVKTNKDGLISCLEMVYDFADGVRDFSGSITGMDVTSIEGTAGANETYVGGKVTDYKKSSALANVDGSTIKLSQAQNVYVIDANGRDPEINVGSISDFDVYEELYDPSLTDVNIMINGSQITATQAEAQCAADYVYARVYDGKVVDLVIVKGIINEYIDSSPDPDPEPDPEPEPEAPCNYAYVTAATLDADVLTGANTALVQMVTADGVEVNKIKATRAKVNDAIFDADAVGAAATLDTLEGSVVKYTKNSSNLITSITTINSDDTIGYASYIFDENDRRFVGNPTFYVNTDSTVFFVDEWDIQDSCMGTLLDLNDGETYDVLGKFNDTDSNGNDIVVIFADMESPEEEPDPDICVGYAYVTAATLDADILTGANTAIVQMVTAEGLVVLNVKATNAKINGVTFDADAPGAATTLDALEGTVVKYTKNSNGLITSITTADADPEIAAAITSDTTLAYDAENGKFAAGPYLDGDAIVFFIAAEAEDSYLGTVADLEDEMYYSVHGLYADEKAVDNNILVVEATNAISPKANMGVLTAIGMSENEDGEAIYSLEVMVNGETIVADTTAEAADSLWGNLTIGDIIKVKIDRNGLIASLELVYDFYEGVRDLSWWSIADMDVTAYEGIPSAPTEMYVGGKVTNYKKSSTLATVNGETIKLSQAQNVYVIDANGRNLEIKQGSASNFKAYDALYDATLANVNVTINKVDMGSMALAEAQKAADYVYARVYDGKVADLVIVKGAADMRVIAGDTVEIGMEIATGTHYGKAAADLGTFSVAANSTTFTVTGTANEITDWTEYSTDDASNNGYFVPLEFTGVEGSYITITQNGNTTDLGICDDYSLNQVFKLDEEISEIILEVDGTVYTIVFDVYFIESWNYSLSAMSVNTSDISLFAVTNSTAVLVKNLSLAGEMAEKYNLVCDSLYSTVKSENISSLTINAENGVVTGFESGNYLTGSKIKLTATPNLGYIFKGWFKADRCIWVDENYEFVLSADTELIARFDRLTGLSDCGLDEGGMQWLLYEIGVLQVSGNGDMYNYPNAIIIPWYSAREKIREIVIDNGISHIGDRSFYNCISAQKVVIPESVTSIGEYAFKNCDLITIYGVPGSYAETYANENSIPFVEYIKIDKLHEITVDMTENEQRRYFDISVDEYTDPANAYVAIYAEDDRLMSVMMDSLATDDLTTIFLPKHSDDAYAKIYVLKTDLSIVGIPQQIDFDKE